MRSPFPGMDPYLETPAFWPDFHQSFMTYWRDAINDLLPEHYEARLEDRVRLVQSDKPREDFRPDLSLERQRRRKPPAAAGSVRTLVLDRPPVTLPLASLDIEEERQASIRILHRPDRTLVTLLELLSPSNKIGEGYRDYLAKRNVILHRPVHLVELDLLIGGERLPLAKPLPYGDYYAFAARADERPEVEVYAWSVRESLPPILVPLKAPDPDLRLDLAQVFATTYERGRYAPNLYYQQPPPAPLRRADTAWARKLARSMRPKTGERRNGKA